MLHMVKRREWGEDPEFSGPRDWFRNSLIISEIKKCKTRGLLLDFGAGNGNLVLRLAKDEFTCLGIDKSKTAIRNLNKRAKKLGFSNKAVGKVGDEKSILRLGNKFDVIVSGETLEHIKNDRKVVNSFYKKLKRGGICVISVPAHQDYWDINDDYSGHFRRYERDNLIKLFSSAGLRVKSVYYWGFPLTLLWHKFIYLPVIKKKITKGKNYTETQGLLGRVLSIEWLKKTLSYIFWFDTLFNWTNLGGGLIMVAKK